MTIQGKRWGRKSWGSDDVTYAYDDVTYAYDDTREEMGQEVMGQYAERV